MSNHFYKYLIFILSFILSTNSFYTIALFMYFALFHNHKKKWFQGVSKNIKYNRSIFHFLEPNFVGSFDIGEHVFFFFRETAVEYINCGKSVYSRVARVCKRDTGGKNILSQNWATYLKARLNCSIPGEFPFYFNEIRKLTSIGLFSLT